MSEPRKPAVVGIVLAAGAGTRFGRPKADVRVDGERFVDRAVRTLRGGGCSRVLVVTGALPLAPVVGAEIVSNPEWRSGMASSLQAGLAAAADADAVVVTLVDMPWLGPGAVTRLLDAFARGARIAAAEYDGTRAHPILFAHEHVHGVARGSTGDRGARDYLAAHAQEVVAVDCTGTGDPRDVDTADDLGAADDLDATADAPGPPDRPHRDGGPA
ncbi:nucleotidyltransferase family protein [Rhodococcus sp. HNM0569]|nr:nucleotidyltransferase family protein [Rhodococcus sp. HNM0569]